MTSDHRHSHVHHEADADAIVAAARARCAALGETLTPLRQRVLELLWARHAPTKAYDLLAELGDGSGPAKPPTVYRTLEFLVRLGLAHRIETLNAFIACDIGACARPMIFLICSRCGRTQEIEAGHAAIDLAEAAAKDNFTIERTVIEASGLCGTCRLAA